MAFLVEADITDKVAIPFIANANTDINTYLTKGDEYIESLAQSKGVLDPNDIATPMVIELKEYGLAKMYIELFQDASFVNNNEAFEEDKYMAKLKYYKDKANANAKVLTYHMIVKQVQDKTDRHAYSFDVNRS